MEVPSFQGFFNIELGPYKNVLNIEVSSFQEYFGPYKSVLIIEVSSFQGVLIQGAPL